MELREFENVWDALADTPEEAANLTVRSDLMIAILGVIKQSKWRKARASERCGLTVPRMQALLSGEIDAFSIEDLLAVTTRLGLKPRLKLERAGAPSEPAQMHKAAHSKANLERAVA